MDYILFFGLVFVALFVSGLFVWGVWELLTAARHAQKKYEETRKAFAVTRNVQNPILEPGKYDFEGQAVMNPAAIHDGDTTHLFYRAIGNDGVSRIGYATSEDGETIDDRLPYPVFALEGPDPHLAAMRRAYAEKNYPALVASGGSWGGTEDPRAVIIDDRAYLSFSAFHNWDSVRIGITSIAMDDLKNKRWKWSPPTFLSPQNQVHKNWVLFPEKIFGKFAFIHSISPSVEIEYRNNISSIGTSEPFIHSPERARSDIVDTKSGFWHSRMRGAGTPPIKTPYGWLLFYHAMHAHEPHKYKLGAMMLDKDDPSKVIARAPTPVLEPETHYENGGIKPGIVYASGTTVHDNKLTLYYGAADNVVCSATAPFNEFVETLIRHGAPKLTPKFAIV
jgi:predicted GH43/DUF377 family glycosyl hydrolase